MKLGGEVLVEAAGWLDRFGRTPRIRTMREFAESEIVIPSGRFRDERFRTGTQPFSAVWFDLVDSGLWTTFLGTGPVQSGKTLISFVVPIMYHLFELEEDVIAGVPDENTAKEKWRRNVWPILSASKYAELLPTSGGASRGGFSRFMQFRNGAALRWMTAGGGDKARAHYDARVLCATEIDGYDESAAASDETTKLDQMIARLESWPAEMRRIYLECTLTTKAGRTWQEYEKGTMTELLMGCVHCGAYVKLGRECVKGWEDAESEEEAKARAYWACPACGEKLSQRDLVAMNRGLVAVHRGQRVEVSVAA